MKKRRDRSWEKSHPEKLREYRSRRRQRLEKEFSDGTRQRATEQICCSCKSLKSSRDFHISNFSTSGLNSLCKLCNKNRVRQIGRTKLGVAPEQYDVLFEKQGKVCAICGIGKENKRHFSLDHNHRTGKVRGILCTKCNMGLGYFSDNTLNLTKAIAYLEKNDEDECKNHDNSRT